MTYFRNGPGSPIFGRQRAALEHGGGRAAAKLLVVVVGWALLVAPSPPNGNTHRQAAVESCGAPDHLLAHGRASGNYCLDVRSRAPKVLGQRSRAPVLDTRTSTHQGSIAYGYI